MFGRKMNKFRDYSQIAFDKSVELRSAEIKELVEKTQPIAIDNIQKKQLIQQKQQNKRDKAETPIKFGTIVTIKSLKIQGKLMPKYIGVYTITRIIKKGIFYLTNSIGKQMAYT